LIPSFLFKLLTNPDLVLKLHRNLRSKLRWKTKE
jgi:hypothetical protein